MARHGGRVAKERPDWWDGLVAAVAAGEQVNDACYKAHVTRSAVSRQMERKPQLDREWRVAVAKGAMARAGRELEALGA